jgi:hypothetical protein
VRFVVYMEVLKAAQFELPAAEGSSRVSVWEEGCVRRGGKGAEKRERRERKGEGRGREKEREREKDREHEGGLTRKKVGDHSAMRDGGLHYTYRKGGEREGCGTAQSLFVYQCQELNLLSWGLTDPEKMNSPAGHKTLCHGRSTCDSLVCFGFQSDIG